MSSYLRFSFSQIAAKKAIAASFSLTANLILDNQDVRRHAATCDESPVCPPALSQIESPTASIDETVKPLQIEGGVESVHDEPHIEGSSLSGLLQGSSINALSRLLGTDHGGSHARMRVWCLSNFVFCFIWFCLMTTCFC